MSSSRKPALGNISGTGTRSLPSFDGTGWSMEVLFSYENAQHGVANDWTRQLTQNLNILQDRG